MRYAFWVLPCTSTLKRLVAVVSHTAACDAGQGMPAGCTLLLVLLLLLSLLLGDTCWYVCLFVQATDLGHCSDTGRLFGPTHLW